LKLSKKKIGKISRQVNDLPWDGNIGRIAELVKNKLPKKGPQILCDNIYLLYSKKTKDVAQRSPAQARFTTPLIF